MTFIFYLNIFCIPLIPLGVLLSWCHLNNNLINTLIYQNNNGYQNDLFPDLIKLAIEPVIFS